MKKILLTTTALVGFAGAAAADVAISGYAEMGINGGTGQVAEFHQDIDVTFAMSGETDGGLSFGASVDIDETLAGTTTDDDHGTVVNISGGFGNLTMGDTDGAMDWAMQEANIGNAGSIGDDETAHIGFLGSYLDGQYDGQVVRYDNTFGAFGVAISVEADDDGGVGGNPGNYRDTGYAIGLKYSIALGAGSVDLGLGYQSVDGFALKPEVGPVSVDLAAEGATAVGISISSTFDNGLSAALTYTAFDLDTVAATGDDEDVSHIGVGLGYTTGAITVSANYGTWDLGDDASASGFGLAAAYDLGGGASMHFGYGNSTIDDGTNDESADSFSLGLALSF